MTVPVAQAPADRPLVFVDDLDSPQLDPDDRHHLDRVLRLRNGDEVTISDGRGRWRAARFGPHVGVDGALHVEPVATPPLTVAFALVKGGRPELVTQKLTELGIDRVTPFVAERSVARWEPARAARHVERLRRIAREASMQSRRCTLPTVDELSTFAAVAARPGAALAERHGVPPNLERPVVLVGPEGGWSPAELAHDLPRLALGSTVLRAETAAITAGALLAGLRAGVVASGQVDDSSG
jgi:16S rRNA (uracil1498-N3)-methyltransferase